MAINRGRDKSGPYGYYVLFVVFGSSVAQDGAGEAGGASFGFVRDFVALIGYDFTARFFQSLFGDGVAS